MAYSEYLAEEVNHETHPKSPSPTHAPQLLAQAEATIEQFLDWLGQTERPTLTHIEDAVLEFRRQFGQALAETALQEQETHPPVPGPQCPTCHDEMHTRTPKPRPSPHASVRSR